MSDEPKILWGLWHNGWCCIDSAFPETRYAGTLEDVEAQKKVFEAEHAKDSDHPGFRAGYDIVPFDKDREPDPTAKRVRSAAEAQKNILHHIHKHGNFPTPMTSATRFSPGTRTLIYERAWIMDDLSKDGQVDFRRPLKLTKRGLAELQNVQGKKT